MGRGKGNSLILADARVSRNHALFRSLGRGKYYLLDLGSANGILLNGRLVTSPAELKDGDIVLIGDCSILYVDLARRARRAGGSDESDAGSMETMRASAEALSILVVDIRNFTGLTESIPPMELPAFIGSWFREASAAIESRGGVIDQYVGDSVMAYWRGGRTPDAALARGPLDSALDLVKLARVYEGQLVARHPQLSFAVGCGVHMGEAMFGGPGASARRDFTAVGDCVNDAFRIESLCKELKRPVIVSDEVQAAAGAGYAFEDLGVQKLKGKAADLRVFSARALAGA